MSANVVSLRKPDYSYDIIKDNKVKEIETLFNKYRKKDLAKIVGSAVNLFLDLDKPVTRAKRRTLNLLLEVASLELVYDLLAIENLDDFLEMAFDHKDRFQNTSLLQRGVNEVVLTDFRKRRFNKISDLKKRRLIAAVAVISKRNFINIEEPYIFKIYNNAEKEREQKKEMISDVRDSEFETKVFHYLSKHKDFRDLVALFCVQQDCGK